MTAIVRRAAVALPFAAFVLSVALLAPRTHGGLFLHTGEVAVVAAVLLALVLALRRSLRSTEPSPFEQALRRARSRTPERVRQLVQLEREVELGVANAFDLHYRLRPTLRETAAGLLAARRGVDLDAQPESARAALGEDAWEIVRGDRPAPIDRTARGADLASIERAVAALEAL